jgi:hypothetical protein
MRKILLLLCILSITFSAKAQLFGKSWKEGAYYDSTGLKHTGLVSWNAPDKHPALFAGKPYINFKTGEKDSVIKVLSTKLRSFRMRSDSATIDSFVVSNDKTFKNKPFLRVILTRDTTVLYCSTVMGSLPLIGLTQRITGGITGSVGIGLGITDNTYYYGSNPNSVIKLSGKRFKEIMSQVMADKPWVVKKIKDSTFTSYNMDDLLYYYRTDKLPESMIAATE